MADPGFLRQWAPTPQMGTPVYYLTIFPQQLHEKNWTLRRSASLAPPGSANDTVSSSIKNSLFTPSLANSGVVSFIKSYMHMFAGFFCPPHFCTLVFALCFIGYLTETANVSRESILSTFTAFTMPSLSLVQKYLMRSEDKSWAGNTTKLLAGEKLHTNCFLPIFHQLHINSEFSHSHLIN